MTPAQSLFIPLTFPTNLAVCRDKGDGAHGAAAAANQLQRRGDHYRTRRWQSLQVTQAGQSELTAAVHDVVIRKRRIERAGLSGIRADCLDADPQHIALVGKNARRCLVEAGTMRAVL